MEIGVGLLLAAWRRPTFPRGALSLGNIDNSTFLKIPIQLLTRVDGHPFQLYSIYSEDQ